MVGNNKHPIIKINNLTKVFGNRYVLNNLNLTINSGDIFGIIGTSGSGKSTFLNTLVGFLKADKGDVKFRDLHLLSVDDKESFRSVYKHQKDFKNIYGFASQSPSFYPNLTVIENLLYFGSLYNLSKASIQSNANNLLNLMGLTYARKIIAKSLSGGMQRRLDIACSLIHDPKILILDEPTADLDPVLASNIWNLIRIINQKGTTVIVASHHLRELEKVCNQVAILKEGHFAAIGKPNEIKSKNSIEEKFYLKTIPGNYESIMERIKQNFPENIKSYDIDDDLIIHVFKTGNLASVIVKITEELGEKIIIMESIKPSLDEVFIEINEDHYIDENKPKKRNRK